MKRIYVAVVALCASLAHAEVYKWVDEQGEIHFGDQPPSRESAEKVKLPKAQVYRPRPVPADEEGEASPEEQTAPFEGYETVAILQPSNGGTVRSNEQKVTVFISLKPDLQPGHKVSLLLDGSVIGAGAVNAPLDLTGVARGSHTLQVRVAGETGQILIESATVSFTLRQSGVAPFSNPQQPADGTSPSQPVVPTAPPTQPIN